jgi:Fe2+ or Zn2+ uptake regulation protein
MSGVNDIATTHPQLIKYFPNGLEQATKYMIGTHESFYFKCPKCGRIKTIKTRPIDIIKNSTESIGCICGSKPSYCEKFVYRMFELLHVNFTKEYGFEWIDSRRKYDFYFNLNNNEYIVETDGYWHNHDNNMSGQTAEESQAIDDYKDRLAQEHGIEVIRIDCDFYGLKSNQQFNKIKTNLIEKLSNILNLKNIDWDDCNNFGNTIL